jgi:hypothetical protein
VENRVYSEPRRNYSACKTRMSASGSQGRAQSRVYCCIAELCRQHPEVAKPDAEYTGGLDVAAVRLTAVQVIKLPL